MKMRCRRDGSSRVRHVLLFVRNSNFNERVNFRASSTVKQLPGMTVNCKTFVLILKGSHSSISTPLKLQYTAEV